MSAKTGYLLTVLHIVSWIIFIGVCIEAGAFIFNAFITLYNDGIGTEKFYTGINLANLYQNSETYFLTVISFMIIVAVMRCILFYSIIKMFYEKKLQLSLPFNDTMLRFILNIAYLALGIGLFSFWGAKYTEGLLNNGVKMPGIQYLRLAGADVWLFMGIILLVIAQMFKKGISLQIENDLTV